jgi:hypothetical protein
MLITPFLCEAVMSEQDAQSVMSPQTACYMCDRLGTQCDGFRGDPNPVTASRCWTCSHAWADHK